MEASSRQGDIYSLTLGGCIAAAWALENWIRLGPQSALEWQSQLFCAYGQALKVELYDTVVIFWWLLSYVFTLDTCIFCSITGAPKSFPHFSNPLATSACTLIFKCVCGMGVGFVIMRSKHFLLTVNWKQTISTLYHNCSRARFLMPILTFVTSFLSSSNTSC